MQYKKIDEKLFFLCIFSSMIKSQSKGTKVLKKLYLESEIENYGKERINS